MPFRDEIFEAPAIRSDVATVSINTAVALYHVVDALRAIHKGDLSKLPHLINEIDKIADKLNAHFDELTGYTKK